MKTVLFVRFSSWLALLAGGIQSVSVFPQSWALSLLWLSLGVTGTGVIRLFAYMGQIMDEDRGQLKGALANMERSLFQVGATTKEIRDMVKESVRETRKREFDKKEGMFA